MQHLESFVEKPQCAVCLSKSVTLRFWEGYESLFGGAKELDRIECECQRCLFSWYMQPAFVNGESHE